MHIVCYNEVRQIGKQYFQEAYDMNYGKKGLRKKKKALHATSVKLGRKLTLLITKAILTSVIAVVIIGISAGIGVFRGILSSAPDISHIDV